MGVLKGDFVYRDGYDLKVRSALGSTLSTNKGDFIDLQACSGANILGYSHKHLELALAAGRYVSAKPQIIESDTRLHLVSMLQRIIADETKQFGCIGFELSGSAAVELAIKIAISKAAEKKPLLVTLESCYHGRSIYVANLTNSRRYVSHKLSFDQLFLPNVNCVSDGEEESNRIEEGVSGLLEYLQEEEETGDYLPIFIYETIQNVGGGVEISTAYLARIQEIVSKFGGVTIADEIFTGIYRISRFFDSFYRGLSPDIVVFSKGLTNGMLPLSAVWVSDSSKLEESFKPGTHSSTYLNCDFTFSTAIEVLTDLKEMEFKDGELGNFSQKLMVVLKEYELQCYRNYCCVELPDGASAIDVRKNLQATEPGVIMAFTSMSGNRLLAHPAYTISDAEIEASLTAIKSTIKCLIL